MTKERKPLGYLDVAGLKAKWEASQVDPVFVLSVNSRNGLLDSYPFLSFETKDASVMKHMTKFHRSPSQTYTLITPDTPLEDLEDFLKKHIFALGKLVPLI